MRQEQLRPLRRGRMQQVHSSRWRRTVASGASRMAMCSEMSFQSHLAYQ